MGWLRLGIVGVSVALAVGGLLSCRGDHPPARPSRIGDWFVLEIEQDGSLNLNGQRIDVQDSAKSFALLAEKARSEAHVPGKDIEPKAGVPAGILIWADDATPFSTVFHALRGCCGSGFHRFLFLPNSAYPSLDATPSPLNLFTPVVEEKTDIPDAIGTLPIHLHADPRGRIDWVELGEQDLQDFQLFERQITSIGGDADSPFEKARLDVDPRVVFSELVRVIELLGRVGVKSITYVCSETRGET